MSAQIFTANLTDNRGLQIQGAWEYESDACGRVATDYNKSIICRQFAGGFDYASNFMKYSKCCPSDEGKNTYVMQRDCSSIFCYTSDEKVALNYSQCVTDTTAVGIEEAKANGTLNGNKTSSEMFSVRCEYIDYEMLKKGIVDSDTSSGAVRERVLSLKAVVGVVGLGAFAVAIGVM